MLLQKLNILETIYQSQKKEIAFSNKLINIKYDFYSFFRKLFTVFECFINSKVIFLWIDMRIKNL